jgi:ABC-type multidrug transport system fused ATPase/permease subunit
MPSLTGLTIQRHLSPSVANRPSTLPSQNLTTLAFGYFLALYYDWKMALVVTGILPLMVVAQVWTSWLGCEEIPRWSDLSRYTTSHA